jgi:hypothetical protein
MTDIQIKTMALPSVFLMEASVPEEVVNSLNNYLDNLLKEKDRESAAWTLVGQIHGGEQLTIDYTNDTLKDTHNFLCGLGARYISEFSARTGQPLRVNRQVAIEHLWSVHSYGGDYNPIHDQITKQPNPTDGEFTYKDSSGNVDGFIEFIFGQNAVTDTERLKPTSAALMKPEVGKIYYFPSWLQHTVYPFRGEGERRTVAANFNCFPMEEKHEPTK